MNPDLIKPLPHKKIEHSQWYSEKHPTKVQIIERVLFFDPTEIYNRISHKIDPTKRHAGIQVDDVFPKLDGKCACGCNIKPQCSEPGAEYPWQRKWASDVCSGFASDVVSIINNYFGKPAYYISIYFGKKCSQCDETNEIELELDHIVGVKQGGGGCWLSNYRWLCRKHHTQKTNNDFGRKSTVAQKGSRQSHKNHEQQLPF